MKALGINPQRELVAFASCFIAVVRRSRLPNDVLRDQQIGLVQRQTQQRGCNALDTGIFWIFARILPSFFTVTTDAELV